MVGKNPERYWLVDKHHVGCEYVSGEYIGLYGDAIGSFGRPDGRRCTEQLDHPHVFVTLIDDLPGVSRDIILVTAIRRSENVAEVSERVVKTSIPSESMKTDRFQRGAQHCEGIKSQAINRQRAVDVLNRLQVCFESRLRSQRQTAGSRDVATHLVWVVPHDHILQFRQRNGSCDDMNHLLVCLQAGATH
jgi:hypothetical protein